MAELLRGKPVADALLEETRQQVEELAAQGIVPTLALIRVGEREDDLSYERGAEKRCAAAGVALRKIVLPADCTQGALMEAIAAVNADNEIHGCLLFRPLPVHLDEAAACAALAPEKDVDGITPGSLYGVFADKAVGFAPCTAEACVRLIEHYGHTLEGAKVVVIGRSLVIGKPVAMMLLAKNATVCLCHTRTKDVAALCQDADIVIAAAGHAGVMGVDTAQPQHIVVDVGINWDASTERLVGDVAFDEVEPVVRAITPVPGGVGSVTTAVLVHHVVAAAQHMGT